MDAHDDHFFSRSVHAIEKYHRLLPKQSRIRVQRWVEKLVASGGNHAYVRHRDAYTKLLLNMVLTRKLDEPFAHMPPDGQLPPFPTHLKVLLRPPFGQQESDFWNDVIGRLQDEAEAHGDITTNTTIHGSHIQNNSSIHNTRYGGEDASRAMPVKSSLHHAGTPDVPERRPGYGAGVAGVIDVGNPHRTPTGRHGRHHHVAFSEQKAPEPEPAEHPALTREYAHTVNQSHVGTGETPSKFGGYMHASFVGGDPPKHLHDTRSRNGTAHSHMNTSSYAMSRAGEHNHSIFRVEDRDASGWGHVGPHNGNSEYMKLWKKAHKTKLTDDHVALQTLVREQMVRIMVLEDQLATVSMQYEEYIKGLTEGHLADMRGLGQDLEAKSAIKEAVLDKVHPHNNTTHLQDHYEHVEPHVAMPNHHYGHHLYHSHSPMRMHPTTHPSPGRQSHHPDLAHNAPANGREAFGDTSFTIDSNPGSVVGYHDPNPNPTKQPEASLSVVARSHLQPSVRDLPEVSSTAKLPASRGTKAPASASAGVVTRNQLSLVPGQDGSHSVHHHHKEGHHHRHHHHHEGTASTHHHPLRVSSSPGQLSTVAFPESPIGHPPPTPAAAPAAPEAYLALPPPPAFPISTVESALLPVPAPSLASTALSSALMPTTPSSRTLSATQQTQRWINESQIVPVAASKAPSMQFPSSAIVPSSPIPSASNAVTASGDEGRRGEVQVYEAAPREEGAGMEDKPSEEAGAREWISGESVRLQRGFWGKTVKLTPPRK